MAKFLTGGVVQCRQGDADETILAAIDEEAVAGLLGLAALLAGVVLAPLLHGGRVT